VTDLRHRLARSTPCHRRSPGSRSKNRSCPSAQATGNHLSGICLISPLKRIAASRSVCGGPGPS